MSFGISFFVRLFPSETGVGHCVSNRGLANI